MSGPSSLPALSQCKSKHTIKDKLTGQVLGFAFLVDDQSVSSEQIQLVPWHVGALKPQDDGHGGDQALLRPFPSLNAGDVPSINIVSDLDLSDDSSTNETIENDVSQTTDDVENNQGNQRLNTPSNSNSSSLDKNIQSSCFIPISSPPTKVINIQSPLLVAQQSASNPHQTVGVISSFQPLVSRPRSLGNCSPPRQPVPNNPTIIQQEVSYGKVKSLTQSMALDIASTLNSQKLAKLSDEDSEHLCRKRTIEKVSDVASIPNKKFVYKTQASTGKNAKYEAFFEFVSNEAVAKPEYRKVRCLLCGDVRILSVGNFHRHIRAIHEPPVQCEGCGRQYNREQIRKHMKKCVQVEQSENIFQVCPETGPGSSMSTPIERFNSGASPVQCQDQVSASVSSQDTASPVLVDDASKPGSDHLDNDMVYLELNSITVVGANIKMKLRKEVKIKKAMRAFGRQHNVDYKKMRFLLGAVELTGEEIVGDLNGNQVDVYGHISQ